MSARRVVCRRFGRVCRAARCLTTDHTDFIEFVFMVSPLDGRHEGEGKHERMCREAGTSLHCCSVPRAHVSVSQYTLVCVVRISYGKNEQKTRTRGEQGYGDLVLSIGCPTISDLQGTSIDWPVRYRLTSNPQSWRPKFDLLQLSQCTWLAA